MQEKKSDAAQNKALLPEHPFGGYGKYKRMQGEALCIKEK
jgi:hypothetical protein